MKKTLSPEHRTELLKTLKERFAKNTLFTKPEMDDVATGSKPSGKTLDLAEMNSGGEPDVVGFDKKTGDSSFTIAPESPKGRRSLCYDRAAWRSRKEHKPPTPPSICRRDRVDS